MGLAGRQFAARAASWRELFSRFKIAARQTPCGDFLGELGQMNARTCKKEEG
jgi:hypothetical protein